MALSIIRIGEGYKSFGLYNSIDSNIILVGTYEELSETKHKIETAEQETANKEYMDNLRKERIDMLVLGGNTPEQATEFLKTYMPFLFTKNEN